MTFIKPLNNPINLGIMSQITPSKGNLAWEYNPFRNYRLSEPKYYFRNKYLSESELLKELGAKSLRDQNGKALEWNDFKQSPNLPNGIKPNEGDPIFYAAGQLVDFDTDELEFDVNHPVDILPQYSYDGSVNLIINDGKNTPKLINSRFSPLGKQQYQIVDRKGDNDTNIYDQGEQFSSDTSLYKTYLDIPKIFFRNVFQGGNLSVGNYHFYFRYVDADGNETDFIGESGLVSIFKGNTLKSINSGFRDEDSDKSVKFLITNIDPSYQYINIYYTRSTSDLDQNAVVSAYKIDQKFPVNNSLECYIHITGNEPKTEITVEDINPIYLIADQVQTQDQCQNRLFFGSIHTKSINYTELQDLSLRFTLKPDTSKEYTPVPHLYNTSILNTYSDPRFIYNYTGYQNHEIYRFGIVYIMQDGTLSPVFNVRGKYFSNDNTAYINFPIRNNGDRVYITSDEITGIVYYEPTENSNKEQAISATDSIENAYGVVRIDIGSKDELKHVIGIRVDIQDKDALYKELNKLNIKGFFFVRQKRMPLRLCQAFTVGIDKQSHIPMPYVDREVITGRSGDKPAKGMYIAERFQDASILTQNFSDRLYWVEDKYVKGCGAICPEYDINSPYYNTLFCGNEYIIEQVSIPQALSQDTDNKRHFYIDNYTNIGGNPQVTSRVLGVEDNVKLVAIDDNKFSARAGEAEEAIKFEYLGDEPPKQEKETQPENIVRGSFGPYIGLDKYTKTGTLVNIYINDYTEMGSQELFKLRYNDKSPYYAISDRYSINYLNTISNNDMVLYRGDTYICTFTHKLNRNFRDPDTPTNHTIVDHRTWIDNFFVVDGSISQKKDDNNQIRVNLINRGDINAVELGMWITFPVISSSNLNIRALDKSRPNEYLMQERSFYPYDGMIIKNIPEALCYNKGFNKSLSERYNFESPNVPSIKNDFTNRIAYSDIHINDAFKNGYRVFKATNYRDYPKTYGQITKLVEYNGSLICVFEHGVALIPVNERTVAGNSNGGNVYINTSNVLPENPKILSNTFGSQWKDSVIKTPKGIYGVDTVAKKIWRISATSFECISDFKIQDFLNKNISLSERELTPVIGIRNVKSHYNSHKQDIMFTFYDNLYGFEERVWNVCFNELIGKWVTFYSWIPSYSENIYNQYFSFNRDTSKWITKLGISKEGNSFSDGIVIDNNIIPNSTSASIGIAKTRSALPVFDSTYEVGTLSLANRSLPSGDGVESFVYFTLERDNQQNFKNFEIKYNKYTINDKGEKVPTTFPTNNKKVLVSKETMLKDTDRTYDSILCMTCSPMDICSELYQRGTKDSSGKYTPVITDVVNNKLGWYNNCVRENNYIICKDDLGRRLQLETPYNADKIVTLLNIKANILVSCSGTSQSLKEVFAEGFRNNMEVDGGYYKSTIAVIPEYNKQFLTTDFWKHGKSGIIDIADDIYPTYWYGKQHPFEFEFVVADQFQMHKIFDNLEIISNNAEPESFHYEVVGDCYDFAKDKKNMYIRQEATKELFQYNGSDITFDHNYTKLDYIHRPLKDDRGNIINGLYDMSTILPLYYYRQDTLNEVEDQYHLKDDINTKDFSAMAGAEIVQYPHEYRIWNHAKAVDINSKGRLRGNMGYIEDRWRVQINPINVIYNNETDWKNMDALNRSNISNKIPIELGASLSPLPITSLTYDPTNPLNNNIPDNSADRPVTIWNNYRSEEVKLKDKWIKIRVRYSGKQLAIITAIKTLYSVSYG